MNDVWRKALTPEQYSAYQAEARYYERRMQLQDAARAQDRMAICIGIGLAAEIVALLWWAMS